MEIPIKATVICQNEECGHVSCVIIDPKNNELTHVVVEENAQPYEERMVPVELIQETSTKSIQLSCSKDKFSQLDTFIEHRFVPIEKVYGIYPVRRQIYVPYSSLSDKFADIPYERVPEGEITFHRGATIKATDGEIGKVDEFQIDPSGDHISHLIMTEGHLWNRKEIAIPTSEIDHIEKDIVYLKLNKDQVANLPSITERQRV